MMVEALKLVVEALEALLEALNLTVVVEALNLGKGMLIKCLSE